ncbi:hypothetical protein BC351_40335 [Paenibacillus ferrarius]|uniref:Uncharacterized protein n=1 Tax=Paenibacillus ferrarius TaxID=1469647 RepID=A0A1V4H996_9BACL|nr:hypothetical protein BC351_40335 [Paenibacillus ferrarius]
MAKEGIAKVLDGLSRDHELRTDFYILVARNATANEVLRTLTPLEKIPANKLFTSLEASEKNWGVSSKVDLHQLIFDLVEKGKDPILAGIHIKGEASAGQSHLNLNSVVPSTILEYQGLAVFHKDKLVGWLGSKESKGYNYIRGNIKSTIVRLACPEGGDLAVELINTTHRIKGMIVNGHPEVNVSVQAESNIGEVECKFAQGIIFVEGDGENLLIPTVAEIIGRPLHKYGVSIVNVGSLAFKRYSSIFLRRNDLKPLNIPISIITDLDLKPKSFYKTPSYFELTDFHTEELKLLYNTEDDFGKELHKKYIDFDDLFEELEETFGELKTQSLRSEIIELISPVSGFIYEPILAQSVEDKKTNLYNEKERTKVFLSTPWTLEYALARSSLSREFQEIVLNSHYKKANFVTKQLDKWAAIIDPEELAVDIYRFILDKDISKSIISQNFANHLWENKSRALRKITIDKDLNYLIDAILHVTGGTTSWNLSIQNT